MVSVIIPTYNRKNVIRRSIDSVLNQTYQDFELIIIDDGSTDSTQQEIMNYTDSRIRYIKNEKKLGANGARNIGIRCAKGEYIAFQDSDDVWKKDKLEKQMRVFQNQKNIGVVYSRYTRIATTGETTLIPKKNFAKKSLENEIANILAQGNVIGTPTMVVKKECFELFGLFDEELPRFQDWEMNIRFAQKIQFSCVDEVLVDAYESERSITNTRGSQLRAMTLMVKKHEDFFKKYGLLNKHISDLVSIAVKEKQLKELSSCLGEEQFLHSIYESMEKAANVSRNFSFVRDWIRKDKGIEIVNAFFENYNEKSVAIYGMGDVGHLLVDLLTEENKKKIRFIIDKSFFVNTEYNLKNLNHLEDKDFEGIECILITVISINDNIQEILKEITSVPSIRLSDIIKRECA